MILLVVLVVLLVAVAVDQLVVLLTGSPAVGLVAAVLVLVAALQTGGFGLRR